MSNKEERTEDEVSELKATGANYLLLVGLGGDFGF